jgi:pSer/pThr/pTyr-binding forkhead associated (FHA) protein
MAKLYLKYEQAVLKEVPLVGSVITIGRLPDNTIQLDNLAVSGHHARILWDQNRFVVEDNNSLNGTYVNNNRITRQPLVNGDNILIGKHTLTFESQGQDAPMQRPSAAQPATPAVPKLEQTMVLDTKRMKDMLTSTQPSGSTPAVPASTTTPAASPTSGSAPTQRYAAPPSMIERMGLLTVVSGKTDQQQYLLTSKMSVIGKSPMASIKLKGWFAPKMAAIISQRETGYFIAASEKKIKVKVNGEEISGQKLLANNDTIEVAGVKMTFGFKE